MIYEDLWTYGYYCFIHSKQQLFPIGRNSHDTSTTHTHTLCWVKPLFARCVDMNNEELAPTFISLSFYVASAAFRVCLLLIVCIFVLSVLLQSML